jgi:hypothetical protein
MMYLLPKTEFKMDAQEVMLNFYQFDRKQAKHYFCKNCGIQTFTESARMPGHYRVNLGCVEGMDTFAMDIELFDGKNLL